MDTSGINAVGEEIALDVDATLAPGSTAEGTLGILKMALTDVHDTGSGLHGHLGIDLRDNSGDGRLLIGERLDLSLNASLSADAEIFAQVDADLVEFLPKIHTTIFYDQVLGDVELSTDGGFQMDIGSPQVILEDVTLDVSSVFDSFLGDTFETIKEILLPMKPVVDLLLMDLDLGVIQLKFIDMAYLRLPASVVDNAKKVLEVIQSTLEFIESVDSLSDGIINFGTFNLTAQTLESDEPASDSDAQGASGGGTSHSALLNGPDQKGHKAGKKKKTGKAYRIPFLEEPVQLLNFLLGKGDIDLFWYDLPDLELEFVYRKSFPIYTGLNGVLQGGIGAYTNFDFGFDTRGIRQWMDTGFNPSESWRIFNGFYLDDHGIENTAVDLDEIIVQATVAAGLSLGIGGLVEAGVVGGIEATIGFDLNDKETDFSSDDLPIGDGKLYGSELLDRILQGPQCLFDVHGELRLFLEAFLWIGVDLGFSTITLFEASERFVDILLAEFDWECVLQAPDDIAQLNNGTLTLDYFSGESDPRNYNVDVLPIDENLTLKELVKAGYLDTEYYTRSEEVALRDRLAGWRNTYGDDDPPKEVIVVSTGQRVEVFLASNVTRVIANGTTGADYYSLKRLNGRVASITVTGHSGDDTVFVTGDSETNAFVSVSVDAGPGHDYVALDSYGLGTGTYTIHGRAGDDRLKIQGSQSEYSGVTITGGLGNDIVQGGEGPETIYGGEASGAAASASGFDFIQANGGSDTVYGGDELAGAIEIAGNSGTNATSKPIYQTTGVIAQYTDEDGRVQASSIYQPNGLPFAYYNRNGKPTNSAGTPIVLQGENYSVRSFHGDIIEGGDGNDHIVAGKGFDEIAGGSGVNQLNGGDDPDVLDASGGSASIVAGTGDDLIKWDYVPAGGGATTISGDSGIDRLEINITDGSDVITIDPLTGTSKATVTIGLDELTLDRIEHLKLDTMKSADSVDIGDMLDTTLQSIDVTLGSNKAMEWIADLDPDGNHQVYSDSFEGHDGRVALNEARVGQYFYRYDLQEGGSYVFNTDGSPKLTTQDIAATVDDNFASNQVQRIAFADGLDRIRLQYGNSEPVEFAARWNQGDTAASRAASLKSTLESIDGLSDVTVTGSGTFADEFVVTINAGTRDGNNDYRIIRQQYELQDFVGRQVPRDDTRVAGRLYRIDDAEATYLFQPDGTPDLVQETVPATSIAENRIQQVWLRGFESSGILWFGNKGVAVEPGITDLADRLKQISALSNLDLDVSGTGTNGDPWQIDFSTSQSTILELVVANDASLSDSAVYTRSIITSAEPILKLHDRQQFELPNSALDVTFRYDGQPVPVTLDGTAQTIELALESMPGVTDVEVTKAGGGIRPVWEVVLIDAAHDGNAFHRFSYEITKELGPSTDATLATGSTGNNTQILSIPTGATRALVAYGADAVLVDAGDTAGQIKTALESLKSLQSHDIDVTDGTGEDVGAWIVTLTPGEGTAEYELFEIRGHLTVTSPVARSTSSVEPDNRVQLIDATSGLRTLFYGDLGRDTAYTSAADVKTALEKLPSVREVTVTSESGNYRVTLIDADRNADGDFLPISSQEFMLGATAVQNGSEPRTRLQRSATAATQQLILESWQDAAEFSYGGQTVELTKIMSVAEVREALESLSAIREVRVAGEVELDSIARWNITLLDARTDDMGNELTFERNTGVQRMSRSMLVSELDNLATQWISADAVNSNTTLYYGGTGAPLGDAIPSDLAGKATLLRQTLRTIPALAPSSDPVYSGVEVTVDGTQLKVTSLPASPVEVVIDQGAGLQQAQPAVDVFGTVDIPLGITSIRFDANNTAGIDLDLTGDVSAQLAAFNYGSSVSVTGDGTDGSPWSITITGYDKDNPVTVTYLSGYLAALAHGLGSSYQMIEFDGENGFELAKTSDGNVSVFASGAALPGDNFYISPFQTYELQRPRLLKKPVWELDEATAQYVKTDKFDWFEDPLWENDNQADFISVGGSDQKDYFLIGHEYVPKGELDSETGEPIMERQSDTIQVKHQRMAANGRFDQAARTMVVTIRGIDLIGDLDNTVPDPQSQIYDQIQIDGKGNDDKLIAGFLPNSTELEDDQIITARAASFLTLFGGPGDDRLVGSRFDDELDGGLGNDQYTGNEGVDRYRDYSPSSEIDTLIEARDANFTMSDTQLLMRGTTLSDDVPPIEFAYEERESLLNYDGHDHGDAEPDDHDHTDNIVDDHNHSASTVFEHFRIFGGAGENQFGFGEFTGTAWLDGTEGSDTYYVTLSGRSTAHRIPMSMTAARAPVTTTRL